MSSTPIDVTAELRTLRVRVRELESSLKVALARASQAEHRADLAESSSRAAWRAATGVRPPRQADPAA